MIDTCRRQGVLLMYAEELFFTPNTSRRSKWPIKARSARCTW